MLPNITDLQFAILCQLMSTDSVAGIDLRSSLAQKHGISRTRAAFYDVMSRMEESRLVVGWYENKLVAGVNLRERVYQITSDGAAAVEGKIDFVNSQSMGIEPA